MSLRITDLDMTSTLTAAAALPTTEGGWSLSWLPGRVLGRDQAISGMTIAEVLADPTVPALERDRLVHVLAAELGLTAHDEAVTALSGATEGLDVVEFNPAGDDEAVVTLDEADDGWWRS